MTHEVYAVKVWCDLPGDRTGWCYTLLTHDRAKAWAWKRSEERWYGWAKVVIASAATVHAWLVAGNKVGG